MREMPHSEFVLLFSKSFIICSPLALQQAGEWKRAISLYTEAIKRDPTDARGYNNRSAAHQRLDQNQLALDDVEQAIKRDHRYSKYPESRIQNSQDSNIPTISPVKGYMRKSHVLFAMKEFAKAKEAAEQVRTVMFYYYKWSY